MKTFYVIREIRLKNMDFYNEKRSVSRFNKTETINFTKKLYRTKVDYNWSMNQLPRLFLVKNVIP